MLLKWTWSSIEACDDFTVVLPLPGVESAARTRPEAITIETEATATIRRTARLEFVNFMVFLVLRVDFIQGLVIAILFAGALPTGPRPDDSALMRLAMRRLRTSGSGKPVSG